MVKYRSPFHFLPSDALKFPLDPIILLRAKKKLLAELEISDESTGDFSKNDLLQWFDHLKQEELLHHKYIYDHPSLLKFLEEGKVTDSSWTISLPQDTELQEFILALVEPQFDHLFEEAFREGDVARINELAALSLPNKEKRGRHYYHSTLQLLTANYHQLLELTKEWTPHREPELRELMSSSFFLLLPHLPVYFQPMRDEFAMTLMRFAEDPVNEKYKLKKLTTDLVMLSETLGASAAAQEVINAKKTKLFLDQPTDSASEKKKGKGCLIWIIVIIVLANILRLIISVL